MSYHILMVSVAVLATQIALTAAMGQCKGMDIKVTEEQMLNIKACAKSAGITSVMEMTPEQMGCISKCMMEKKELVDASGKPHKENILKMLDAAMPDAVKEDLKVHMEKCLDSEGTKIDPADASCKTYVPLAKCVHASFMDVCK